MPRKKWRRTCNGGGLINHVKIMYSKIIWSKIIYSKIIYSKIICSVGKLGCKLIAYTATV